MEFRGRCNKLSEREIIDSLLWCELSPKELWDRLLRSNKVVQVVFPKTSFLLLLDKPPYKKVA